MHVGHQDHCGVTVSPTVVLHGLDQPFDLALGEMLPRPVFAVRLSHWYNCELFVVRSYRSQVRSGGHFHLLRLANCAFKMPSIRCRPLYLLRARSPTLAANFIALGLAGAHAGEVLITRHPQIWLTGGVVI